MVTKSQYYSRAKTLARRLRNEGVKTSLPSWVGTTKNVWEKKVKDLKAKSRKVTKTKRRRFDRHIELSEQILKKPKYRTMSGVSSESISKENQKILRKIREGKIGDRPDINNMIREKRFQSVIDYVLDGNTLSQAEAEKFWNTLQGKGRYTIKIDNDYFAVNPTSRYTIIKWLTSGMLDESFTTGQGSDQMVELLINEPESVKIEKYKSNKRPKPNKDGKFFPYINVSKFDLSKYQIYDQDQAYECGKRDHCLIHSLKSLGIKKSLTDNVKRCFLTECNFKKKDLPMVSEIIGKRIKLHHLSNGKCRYDLYGNEELEVIDLAIHSNHYFVYEETEWSQFYLKHYDELKELQDGESVTKIVKNKDKSYFTRGKIKKFINSLQLVENLFKLNYFQKLDMSSFVESTCHPELKEHICLDNIHNEQRWMKDPQSQNGPSVKRDVFYADFESFVNDDQTVHELYLIGVVNGNENDDFVEIINVCDERYETPIDAMCQFLRIVSKGEKPIVYFHNLKYDYHLMEKYMQVTEKIEKDNVLYSFKAWCPTNNKIVEFRDSYKVASFPLAKFGSEFNLPQEIRKKEAIAYKFYTRDNNDQMVSKEHYEGFLPNDQIQTFRENLKDIGMEEGDKFNATEYYKHYLKYDCLVLKKGINKFDQLIREITKSYDDKIELSIFDSLTISSLADKFLIATGAYIDVYEVRGNLREYIGRAIHGGRVHVNEKYKKKVIKGKIADYDGVSLYPSAINRLCEEMGFPIGEAQRICRQEDLKDVKYAVMTVNIKEVRKKQQMPIILHRGKEKSEYSNEVPKEPVIIDLFTLEDYIKFHDIDYEITGGVYWKDGYNNTAGEVVKHLFEARLRCKREGNKALSNVIKLILNSLYGKTILKKSDYAEKIVKEKKFDGYVCNNFNTVRCWRKMNDWAYTVKEITVDNSYNRAHIGCAILSMSKRIMNEVFDVANDNELPIYYTDTDSIHMNYDDVPTLEKEYKKVYGKELNGKKLGQFHCDFDMKDAGPGEEIYATKSIFLGKKSYIDKLESRDKDGNVINDYHIRLKGITQAGLDDAVKKEGGNPFKLFKALASGEERDIILNPYDEENNKEKVLFHFADGSVSTRREFIRTIKF